jgi:hypothetical protein
MTHKLRIFFKSWPAVLALAGAVLAFFSVVNLSGNAAPLAALNGRIVDDLAGAGSLPFGPRLKLLVDLRERQEKALAGLPAEPFAWARLAYLRLATQGDMPDAFAALRLSDLVSPDQAGGQLPERALMWRQLSIAENPAERAYGAVLWQKAFRTQRDVTWQLAVRNKITGEVEDALKQGDTGLYGEWKAREKANP